MTTNLNLIRDPWIPVRRRSGKRSYCAPWEIGASDDPVVALAGPRADLDGGVVQLLIGLLQAVLPPRDDDDWFDRVRRPPSSDELRQAFEPLAPAFELLGSGHRFQQDPRVAVSDAKPRASEKLLIDLGLDEGADHFARVGSVGALCLPCAAAALATLQTSAPAGGRGHLTGLRGGGPLTTLVVAAETPGDPEPPLWMTLWFNVLPTTAFPSSSDARAVPTAADLPTVFPWMASVDPEEPTRSPEVTPEDAHPLQVFFAMPRRLWLGSAETGECGLCGRADVETILDYVTRPNGNRYSGAWLHPLSPYRRIKEELFSVKGYENGLSYRNWLGLVVAPEGSDALPAQVVREFLRDTERFSVAGELRLWAFGYAMDNMKAKAYTEARMPIYEVPPAISGAFANEVRMLIEGAGLVEYYLRSSFKKLVARRVKDVKREPHQIAARFWEATETPFYGLARTVLAALDEGTDTTPHRQSWHRTLVDHARHLFEAEVSEADFRACDPGQVATAWNELQRSLYGKKLKNQLDLPAAQTKKGVTP